MRCITTSNSSGLMSRIESCLSQGNMLVSKRRMILSPCPGAQVGECLANHSRAIASKVFDCTTPGVVAPLLLRSSAGSMPAASFRRSSSKRSRRLEADLGVYAEGKALLLSLEPVFEAPPATARRRDLKIQAAAVKQPVRLLSRLRVDDLSVRDRHGFHSLAGRKTYGRGDRQLPPRPKYPPQLPLNLPPGQIRCQEFADEVLGRVIATNSPQNQKLWRTPAYSGEPGRSGENDGMVARGGIEPPTRGSGT